MSAGLLSYNQSRIRAGFRSQLGSTMDTTLETKTGISFSLTEEQRMLQGLAREFARSEMAPVAEHYDCTAEFPMPVIQKARQAGLLNINIPMEYGGGGASLMEECLVGEELAWGCSGIGTTMTINN